MKGDILKAVIFDFDGIIVDTEPIHYQAFQKVLKPRDLGYSWEEYLELYIGFDDRDAFREVFRTAARELDERRLDGLINEKADIFARIVSEGVRPYPGAVELVRSLSGVIPVALCSGALSRDIQPILRQLSISDAFDVVVTADDVRASKPDPESYLLAFSRIAMAFPEKSITPAECLAIEDTPSGIASALKAGLRVLAVTNSYPAEKLGDSASITNTLETFTLSRLASIADRYF